MPVTLDPSTLRQAPDVRTGATASGKVAPYYAQGQVNDLPNGGQITSTGGAEPNDAVTLDASTLREAPSAASPTPTPPATSHDFSTELLKETPWALGQAGIGAAKSLGNTLYGLSTLVVPDKDEATNRHIFDSSNPVQGVGRSAEQTGEFLIPGLGEEAATKDLAEAFPKLAPLSRITYNTLTSGALNKAQGGDFTTGAVAGGAGSALAEGGKAIAPGLAEGAMGIRKLDRAYGRRPGAAILEETRGFRPETVEASAQSKLAQLTPRLESLVDAASSRPRTPVMGFLPPPPTEIPTGEILPPDTPGELIPAAKMPLRNLGVPEHSTYIPVMPKVDAFMTSGTREAADLPRSGPGVLLRRPELKPFELPPLMPNPIASLRPARSVVSDAISKATTQNAGGTVGQLTPLRDFLAKRFDTGEEIPELVTPRQLLDLRRGFNDEFVTSWNPETQPGVTGAARQGYHALTNELHSLIPETAPIDRRISSLIPVAKRAASADLNAGVAQRVADRIGRPTGGTLPIFAGAHIGGPVGAVIGAVAPDALSAPSPRMFAARALSRSHQLGKTAGWLERLLLGAGLQSQNQDQQ